MCTIRMLDTLSTHEDYFRNDWMRLNAENVMDPNLITVNFLNLLSFNNIVLFDLHVKIHTIFSVNTKSYRTFHHIFHPTNTKRGISIQIQYLSHHSIIIVIENLKILNRS